MDKRERQRATAQMTKCACGNVARLGTTQCGACTKPEYDDMPFEELTIADLEQIRELIGGSKASKSHIEKEVLLAKVERVLEPLSTLLLETPVGIYPRLGSKGHE